MTSKKLSFSTDIQRLSNVKCLLGYILVKDWFTITMRLIIIYVALLMGICPRETPGQTPRREGAITSLIYLYKHWFVHIMCSIHLNIESINKHTCTHVYIYIYPYKHRHIHIQNIKIKQELLFFFLNMYWFIHY